MNMDPLRLHYLLSRQVNRQLSPEEEAELGGLLLDPSLEQPNLAALGELLLKEAAQPTEAAEAIVHQQFKRIVSVDRPHQRSVRTVHRIHFLKTAWFRYAAAILLMVATGLIYFSRHNQLQKPPVNSTLDAIHDILPGANKAMLTLSDGTRMVLDTGTVAAISDGERSITNKNGELVYVDEGKYSLNTMTTPRGGHYRLLLADGTKVWLNAATTITYPTVFREDRREVTVRGEAYFEVAPDKTKPFTVATEQDTILVLGTSFNVNVYGDEPARRVTLVSGTVRVGTQQLLPGQASQNGKIVLANVEQDIAWTKGLFSFTDLDLKGILRQVSRWYDVEVVYEGEVPKGEFTGTVSRSLSLSKLLSGLSGYGFSYRIDNKKVFISER